MWHVAMCGVEGQWLRQRDPLVSIWTDQPHRRMLFKSRHEAVRVVQDLQRENGVSARVVDERLVTV